MKERIDYTHYASKYAYATGNDGSTWSKADLKVLLDEIKRSYDLIDKYEVLSGGLKHLLKESWWVATCKPDGEGRCSLEINSYEELMKLVDSNKVEIPKYSHDNDELLLYDEYCTCGISHEEWLESKN